MKFRFLLIVVSIIGINLSYAQYSISDYKYIVLEKQFHFQTEPNQYDLNRMAKFQFEKLGFIVVAEGQRLPDDLKSNYCLALISEITAKGLLRTKAKISLKNCHGETVYISGEGVTKEKDLTRAYDVAIRKAFDTMQGLNYSYKPNEAITSVGGSSEDVKKAEEKIEQLEAEIKELKDEQKDEEVTIKIEPVEEIESQSEETEQEQSTPTEVIEIPEEKIKDIDEADNKLTASQIINGFKLLDKDSNEVMTIFNSGVENIFIVKGKDAIIYKKDDQWIYSETSATNLLTKVMNISF